MPLSENQTSPAPGKEHTPTCNVYVMTELLHIKPESRQRKWGGKGGGGGQWFPIWMYYIQFIVGPGTDNIVFMFTTSPIQNCGIFLKDYI